MMINRAENKETSVVPHSSEEQLRYQEFLEILFQADKRYLEELVRARLERKAVLDSQIEKSDRRFIAG